MGSVEQGEFSGNWAEGSPEVLVQHQLPPSALPMVHERLSLLTLLTVWAPPSWRTEASPRDMVAGGTFPASTVFLTVNTKRATDAGCSMRDRQKAGDYKSRASASLEGEGEAGKRHWIALRPS